MSLKSRINDDLKSAMRGGDAKRRDALRLLLAALKQREVDERKELADADVGLFYYAGHGIQVRGANYLIPVDANLTREADVDLKLLNANLILRQMEGAGTRLNVVIFDACRNDPFSGRGLAISNQRS